MDNWKVNETITISKRWFDNHGVKVIDLGAGTIQGAFEPTKENLPFLLVRFNYHPSFATVKQLHNLLVTDGAGDHKTVLISLHPIYAERVKSNGKRISKVHSK